MTIISTYSNHMDDYERQEIERRRQFIERMEQKLRLKESARREQHNRLSKLRSSNLFSFFSFNR